MMAGASHRPSAHHAAAYRPVQVVVRLRLIGQMEAWTLTSENVLPAGRKTRALLAVIALSSPRPALRGRLAELLWSRRPEEQARASLRQEIHRLLEALAPAGTEILSVTRDHLSLRPGVVWVDVEEVMRATTDQPASLSLLDGDLLEDLDGIDPTFDAWLTTERERLRDRARDRRRGAAARAGRAGGGDPGGAASAADRPCARRRLAGADAGPCRARRARHGDPGLRPLPRRAGRSAGRLAFARDPEAAGGDPRTLGQPHAAAAAGAAARSRAAAAARGTGGAAAHPGAEAAGDPVAPRGGAHVGVMPLQLVGTTEEESHLAPGPRRGDHHRAGALPLDLRGRLQLAGALRRRDARRDARSAAPSASTSCWMARSRRCATGCASPSGCSICGPAIRWSGRAASIGSPTTCCRCRTRSPPRSWRRSIRKSC